MIVFDLGDVYIPQTTTTDETPRILLTVSEACRKERSYPPIVRNIPNGGWNMVSPLILLEQGPKYDRNGVFEGVVGMAVLIGRGKVGARGT